MSPGAADLLDDPGALAAGDRAGLLRATASAAAQVREAGALAAEAGVARFAEEDRPRTVIVLGMGTAGLAGDLLAAVAGPTCPVPVLQHRGFGLPAWVGAADLVMAVSASGRTAETLSGMQEAVRRGCRLLVVTADPSPLAELGRRGRGVVVVAPPGRPAEASLWALAVPLLVAGSALGLLSTPVAVLEAVASALEATAHRCGPARDLVVNPAKTLAHDLLGTLPLLWGMSPLTGVAAARGACQLAQNARLAALAGALPEVGHHQLALLDGAGGPRPQEDLFADPPEDDEPPRVRPHLVLLREAAAYPAVVRQGMVVAELARDNGIAVSTLVGAGETELVRFAELVATLDFASVYLSALRGVDAAAAGAVSTLRTRSQP